MQDSDPGSLSHRDFKPENPAMDTITTLTELAAALQLPLPSPAHTVLEHRVEDHRGRRVLILERDVSGESDNWVAQVGDEDEDGNLVDPSCFEVESLDELLNVMHWVETGVRVAACPSCGVRGRCTDQVLAA